MRLHTFGTIAARPVPHPAGPANPVAPAASASAVPLLTPLAGPIPDSLPVILYQRAGVPPEILGAASWSGTRYEGPTAPVGQGLSRQSPDGGSFLWGGIAHDIKIYPGARHSFMNDGKGSYHPAAAADSWTRVTAFFGEHLG